MYAMVFVSLPSFLRQLQQHAIQSLIQSIGFDEPIIWFILTIAAYLAFGFGGCYFDSRVGRHRNISTGRFVKWETVLIFGTIPNSCILYLMHNSVTSTL